MSEPSASLLLSQNLTCIIGTRGDTTILKRGTRRVLARLRGLKESFRIRRAAKLNHVLRSGAHFRSQAPVGQTPVFNSLELTQTNRICTVQ